MKKTIFYTFTALTLAACSPSFIIPTQADADRMQNEFPGVTLTALTEGKTLMENNCAKCHGLVKPKSRTTEEWTKIIPVMAQKAKLTKEQETKIRQYILTSKSAS